MKRRSFLGLIVGSVVQAKFAVFTPQTIRDSSALISKLTFNSMYGKFSGGRYEWLRPGVVYTTDIVSAYPKVLVG